MMRCALDYSAEVAADERGDGLLVVNGGDGLSELLGDRDGLDLAADLDGMASVTRHSTIGASFRRSMAGPEKMPWVAQT